MEERELAVFCAQLGLILKSGITLHEGTAIMAEDSEEGKIKKVLQNIGEQLEMGKPLDKALAYQGEFPDYMIKMIKIGTQTGRLEQVVMALSDYYEREEALKQSIKGAVFYPLVLCGMMLAVLMVLSIKVLPVFKEVFNNLGGELSGIAQGFMYFGSVIGQYAYGVIIGIIFLALVALSMIKTKKGRAISKKFTNKFKIAEKIAAARFAGVMSLMVASGCGIEEALSMAGELIENQKVYAKVKRCEARVQQGDSFSQIILESGIFPKLTAHMISVGMKTGHIDEVMKQVANQLEEEVQKTLERRVGIIEPLVVAALSIVIGTILISVMLPLMGIMSSIA